MPEAGTRHDWYTPVPVGNDQTFTVLTLLQYFLKQVAPRSHWKKRLTRLFAEYPDIPLHFMGFPENWMACPIWKDKDQPA